MPRLWLRMDLHLLAKHPAQMHQSWKRLQVRLGFVRLSISSRFCMNSKLRIVCSVLRLPNDGCQLPNMQVSCLHSLFSWKKLFSNLTQKTGMFQFF